MGCHKLGLKLSGPNRAMQPRCAMRFESHAPKSRVFGEGVKSARGEIAILGRGDHTRNMFGTSLHTADCRQTIALKTAEIVQ